MYAHHQQQPPVHQAYAHQQAHSHVHYAQPPQQQPPQQQPPQPQPQPQPHYAQPSQQPHPHQQSEYVPTTAISISNIESSQLPRLPRPRACNPLSVALLVCAFGLCFAFFALLVFEFVTIDPLKIMNDVPTRPPASATDRPSPGLAHDDRQRVTLTFDVFDTRHKISPLELTLAVASALGLPETRVRVEDRDTDDIFLRVIVEATEEAVEVVNSESGFAALNQKAAQFGAVLFLARRASVVSASASALRTAPAASSAASSPPPPSVSKRRTDRVVA